MRVERLGDLELVETIYEKRDRIAYVTLNREHAGNSFNTRMCEEMLAIWMDVRDDDDVWVAIVTAVGTRFFCTGVDVKESRVRPMGHVWLPVARLMDQVYKPIVCAVNGICCGGGLHFICDSDIIIGSENAQFFDPHVNVGLVSGWEPVGLSRRIPLNYVLRMVLQGKSYRLDAQEALRIGLLTEVVPADRLLARAEEIARDVLANAPLAVRFSKKAIKEGLNLGLRDALELSAYILKEVWDSEDVKEGARAFEERRPPVWKGR
ncbi:MAG TPA: enoyl-CoA hydratase/isomerase family protein [Actinomycetota bacterium]|nr:enoyl-CoA hydratase/isomerase family protein [Actinomycetota bacterium]